MADTMTPGGWLQTLEPLLNDQAAHCLTYRRYYDGDHPLLFATAKFRQAFGLLFNTLADNWMQVVVDAASERLAVDGFWFGSNATNETAWQVWQANNLDAQSAKAFTEAVKCGRSYFMVSPPPASGREPLITAEHPSQVVVATAPEDPQQRLAALKRWVGMDGYAYANVYLPEGVYKYRSQERVKQLTGTRIGWQGIDAMRNPMGAVPIVALENNPDLLSGGRSDLDTAIPIQNAVNKLCADMLIASEYNAYPQRVATGLEVPLDANGNPDTQAMFRASQAHIWISENAETKFSQLAAGDMNNYVVAIDLLVHHLAAHTRTPAHYLLAKMVNMSADALRAAETGLVTRVKRKQIDFAEPLEEMMRLALKAKGVSAPATDAETIWRDPESQSPAVVADSLIKKLQIGVPLEYLWREAGYTPQQVQEMKTLAGLPDRPPPGATTAMVDRGQAAQMAGAPSVGMPADPPLPRSEQ